jgi:hypothetical protein
MKKYEIEGYTILSSFPYSFQLSQEGVSYRFIEYDPDPDAMYPHRIEIDSETFNDTHVVMHTPNLYVRFVWFEPMMGMEANGQMEMGRVNHSRDYDKYIEWNVLLNGIPKKVIDFIITLLRNPLNVKEYEVPLFARNTNEENNNNYFNKSNNAESLPSPVAEAPPPSPPKPATPKKKRVWKIAKKGANKTQRRRRNV